jgi:hypothetical protein
MRVRQGLVLVLLGLLVLWVAACSSNRASSTSDAESPSPSTTTTTPPETTVPTEPANAPVESQPAAVPSTETALDVEVNPTGDGVPAVDLDVTLPSMEGIFAGASAALDTLSSYRYTTRFEFAAESDETPETGSIEVNGVVVAPDRQQIVWTNLEDGSRFELIEIGGQAWMKEEDVWSEVPAVVADAMSQAVLVFAPAASWSGFYGELETVSNLIGEETVNGIPARHYTSSYSHWAATWQGELTNASADVWIALDGYPVRYRFSASGVDEKGQHGTVSWTMDLSDVNASLTIEPPL